jgi:hypothetical protein
VSHRTTGVDNTGNICVWDSERALAHLLYHHFEDFPIASASPQHILELGTGMAGLAATSLGLRLVQRRRLQKQETENKINVTLTDGHADGVQNNIINQHLTKAFSSASSDHPYHSLNVSSKVLLWTTDYVDGCTLGLLQEIVLVSDCTHFQNFHAALAITMLRSLRVVTGKAIFCQPNRGDSLDNFCSLLQTPNIDGLVSLEWWTHPVLEEQHNQAEEQHPKVYDENLHCPRILLVTKLRDLTEKDCHEFVSHQTSREASAKQSKS